MSYFCDIEGREPIEPIPGVNLRTFWGERMLASHVTIEPNGVVPQHSHMHEQIGVVLVGTADYTVNGESRHCTQGDIVIIPGDAPHGLTAGPHGVQLLEVFSPVREEYQY